MRPTVVELRERPVERGRSEMDHHPSTGRSVFSLRLADPEVHIDRCDRSALRQRTKCRENPKTGNGAKCTEGTLNRAVAHSQAGSACTPIPDRPPAAVSWSACEPGGVSARLLERGIPPGPRALKAREKGEERRD